jgi:hypothetical protein
MAMGSAASEVERIVSKRPKESRLNLMRSRARAIIGALF